LPYYVTLGGTVILGLDRRKLAAVLWRRTMPDFETRLKDVSHAAWLIWTANGLGLDDFELEQTSKSATDTANNAYVEGISNKDWVDDTLMRLRSKELTKTIMVPGNPPAHQTLNSPINSIVAAAKTAHELESARRKATRDKGQIPPTFPK
jgi:hypothetical protein